ncbi:hypothetical protein SKAU_G00182890 [Synaphobranchus kaupii]|uniref:Amidohydrolase-related domain-containing protein n=1 Tax=Synaphobranchus kaupii TaxID=118154 RepID=A0A9Q1IWN2_SYNKA|nr:hypothetical protein SKAU_G00182890 [Synaphobranchus kaupii]
MAANAVTMRVLIKGGKVVNDDFTQEADVYIENGIIQQVGRELMIPGGAKVIDATGKLVIPGGIDTSVHLQQSFMNATTVDDFYSGTKAALAGGTTMVISHVLPEKDTSLLDAYEKCRAIADPKTCCDYALHVGVTWWGPKVRAEMETLVRERGVNSFQMFMAYKDLQMLRDCELYQAFQTCKDIGAVARVHAENGELVAEGAKEALDLGISGPEGIEISRPEELEAEATHRAITIANRSTWSMCPACLQGTLCPRLRCRVKWFTAETDHSPCGPERSELLPPGLGPCRRLRNRAPATPGPQHAQLPDEPAGKVRPSPCPALPRPAPPRPAPPPPCQKAMGKEDFTKIPHGVPGIQDRMSVIWERGRGA